MLAQAVRRIGAFPVVFGSIVIGTLLASPLALVLDLPDWTERSLLLAPLVGILTVVGFQAGFTSFRDGAVSVVAPIIACEGGVAALFSIAGGEHVNGPRPARPAARGRRASCSSRAARGEQPCRRRAGGRRRADLGRRARALGADRPRPRRRLGLPARARQRGRRDAPDRSGRRRARAPRGSSGGAWRSGACATPLAYFAFVLAADHGPAAVAGVLAAQFGTVGAIVAVVFFGERLRTRQVVGIAIVALAVGVMAVGSG